jgi:hypothetical protein
MVQKFGLKSSRIKIQFFQKTSDREMTKKTKVVDLVELYNFVLDFHLKLFNHIRLYLNLSYLKFKIFKRPLEW